MGLPGAGSPLQGLTGLYGDPQDTTDLADEGVLEAKASAPHPDHGHYGSQDYGYSGTVPSASPFSGMAAYDGGMTGTGYAGLPYNAVGRRDDGPDDQTSGTSHQAAYPRGIIQPSWEAPDGEYARSGAQMREVHGADMGGPDFYVNTAIADNMAGTDWTADRYESPHDVMLSANVPGQVRGGGTGGSASNTGRGAGSADVVQGYGKANSLSEFAHGHSVRNVQHDKMPQDYTNTHGEQDVPFRGRHPVQQMPFSGPDSPYYSQGEIDGANTPWEGRIGDPSPYVQPPEPTVTAAPASEDVWAYA